VIFLSPPKANSHKFGATLAFSNLLQIIN
jgi:hypothetical protein